ncbi:MAG: DoxX family protein, partial [Flavobacteriaceae bacterium]
AQNLLQTEMAVNGAVEFGYPESTILYLGFVLLAATVLFIVPKTTILGAALLTGWLGGAVATHLIHGDPILNTLLPVVFGILIWSSILLQDVRFGQFFPIKM